MAKLHTQKAEAWRSASRRCLIGATTAWFFTGCATSGPSWQPGKQAALAAKHQQQTLLAMCEQQRSESICRAGCDRVTFRYQGGFYNCRRAR
jgi:hypothetical protein